MTITKHPSFKEALDFCFFWDSPYIEKFRGNEKLITTLTATTAAFIGIIFNQLGSIYWHVALELGNYSCDLRQWMYRCFI